MYVKCCIYLVLGLFYLAFRYFFDEVFFMTRLPITIHYFKTPKTYLILNDYCPIYTYGLIIWRGQTTNR